MWVQEGEVMCRSAFVVRHLCKGRVYFLFMDLETAYDRMDGRVYIGWEGSC